VRHALHAEWTKLRTLASTFWLLSAAAALTVTVSAAAAAATRCPSGACADDPAKVSLTGIYLGQAVIAVLAVTAASSEYGTGMIRLTLAATPRRLTVLAAKAVVLAVLDLVLVALLSLGAATAVREAAASIGVVLGLLYLFPIIAAVAGNPDLARHVEQIGPMTAGLAIQATTGLGTLPISPWTGLGVLAAWAMGALLLAGVLLRRRDA